MDSICWFILILSGLLLIRIFVVPRMLKWTRQYEKVVVVPLEIVDCMKDTNDKIKTLEVALKELRISQRGFQEAVKNETLDAATSAWFKRRKEKAFRIVSSSLGSWIH